MSDPILAGVKPLSLDRTVTQNRDTIVDRRGIDQTYSEMPSAGPLAASLPQVDEHTVAMQIASGSLFHPENVDNVPFEELRDEYEATKASLGRKPVAPSATQVFGTTEAPKPSDFHRGKENDSTVVDSYVYSGSTYEFGNLANGILNRITLGDSYHQHRLDTYREYLIHLLGYLDKIEEAAGDFNTDMAAYRANKVKLEKLEQVAKLQYAFDRQLSEEQMAIAATTNEDKRRIAELEQRLAAQDARIADSDQRAADVRDSIGDMVSGMLNRAGIGGKDDS